MQLFLSRNKNCNNFFFAYKLYYLKKVMVLTIAKVIFSPHLMLFIRKGLLFFHVNELFISTKKQRKRGQVVDTDKKALKKWRKKMIFHIHT